MAQNFGGSGSCIVIAVLLDVIMLATAALPAPRALVALLADIGPAALPAPDVDTAFSSPPWPVDFSAEVAASVRK